jgi:hypothetical protein
VRGERAGTGGTQRDLAERESSATGRRNEMVWPTVAIGRKPPSAAETAITMAVSAAVISAWPHTVPPTRTSCGSNGSRSVAASEVTASTVSRSAWTHGAKFSSRIACAAAGLSGPVSRPAALGGPPRARPGGLTRACS